MGKYENAWSNAENRTRNVRQLSHIYNSDYEHYKKTYEGKLFCPGCKKVPLVLVNKRQLFLRGYPNFVHGKNCLCQLNEFVTEKIDIINDTINKAPITSQMNALMRLTYGEVAEVEMAAFEPDVNAIPRTRKKGHHTMRRERLPQRLITNLSEDELQSIKGYFFLYGIIIPENNEHLTDEKSRYFRLFTIQDERRNQIPFKLKITDNVWSHLSPEQKRKLETPEPRHIVFLGIKKNKEEKEPLSCSLLNSQWLEIE